jgi:alpha-1,2-mannosyltransferase
MCVPWALQASLWNFVRYNVVGGGDSALYGVEGPTFYLRNGFNNFQFLLPLALALPLVAAAAAAAGSAGLAVLPHPGKSEAKGKGQAAKGGTSATLRLLACVSPLYVWLAAITALPHKEERFLYVAYPLVSGALKKVTSAT